MTLLIDIYLNWQEGLLWREGPQTLDLILYPSRLSCIREGLERSGPIGEGPGDQISLRRVRGVGFHQGGYQKIGSNLEGQAPSGKGPLRSGPIGNGLHKSNPI